MQSAELGYKAAANLSTTTALKGYDKGRGEGARGEIWVCLVCAEHMWEGQLGRAVRGEAPLTSSLHPLVEIACWILAEIRRNEEKPGTYTLTSAQRHALELWRAVHFNLDIISDPANGEVLGQLDKGNPAGVYTQFPEATFLSPLGKALYHDEEAFGVRGYAPNGMVAELTCQQVVAKKLSVVMAMSDELVDRIERHNPPDMDTLPVQEASRTSSGRAQAIAQATAPAQVPPPTTTSSTLKHKSKPASKVIRRKVRNEKGPSAAKRKAEEEVASDNGTKRCKTTSSQGQNGLEEGGVRVGSEEGSVCLLEFPWALMQVPSSLAWKKELSYL